MLTGRLLPLIQFSTTPSPYRWLAVSCLVYAACLVGTLEDQPLRVGISPSVNLKQSALVVIQAAPMAAQYPLEDTFLLHSRPNATKTIYLDYDGHVTSGTVWNGSSNPTITTAPFSFEGDPSFSSNELTRIQEIWERVAECFSPFDVNVTTQAPPVNDLIKSGVGDTHWGVRVAIGVATPDPVPESAQGVGGIAKNGCFNWDSDTPVFVFPQLLENKAKGIADTCVHELGHSLGLSHDGRISPAETYYTGHGTDATGWAPHMGVGYSKYLVQWSKGEYLSANNQEDDLAKITTLNGFGYRPDDHASSRTAALAIGGATTGGTFVIDQTGVIEQRTDSDWFKITAGAGTLSLTAVGGPVNTMLDIQMDLYDGAGTLIASSNPVTAVTASISKTVAVGTYYVRIDGVGNGDPLTTGYTDYGSLGQYHLLGSHVASGSGGSVTATYDAANKSLSLTGDGNPNSVSVTFNSQSSQITVRGSNVTKINNSFTFPSFPHTGPLKLTASLGDGNDSITVTNAEVSTAVITLGNGADSATFTLCKVNTLTVDGGAGTDALVTTSSTIGQKTVTSVP